MIIQIMAPRQLSMEMWQAVRQLCKAWVPQEGLGGADVWWETSESCSEACPAQMAKRNSNTEATGCALALWFGPRLGAFLGDALSKKTKELHSGAPHKEETFLLGQLQENQRPILAVLHKPNQTSLAQDGECHDRKPLTQFKRKGCKPCFLPPAVNIPPPS